LILLEALLMVVMIDSAQAKPRIIIIPPIVIAVVLVLINIVEVMVMMIDTVVVPIVIVELEVVQIVMEIQIATLEEAQIITPEVVQIVTVIPIVMETKTHRVNLPTRKRNFPTPLPYHQISTLEVTVVQPLGIVDQQPMIALLVLPLYLLLNIITVMNLEWDPVLPQVVLM